MFKKLNPLLHSELRLAVMSILVCVGGEAVLKVKHSFARIKNSFYVVYEDTNNFSLARTFQTVWWRTKRISSTSVNRRERRPATLVSNLTN